MWHRDMKTSFMAWEKTPFIVYKHWIKNEFVVNHFHCKQFTDFLSTLTNRYFSLLLSLIQPFVLMAAITSSCSTKKGSVPGMYMPSSWKWPTRRSEHRPFLVSIDIFFFHFLTSPNLKTVRRITVCGIPDWVTPWCRKITRSIISLASL